MLFTLGSEGKESVLLAILVATLLVQPCAPRDSYDLILAGVAKMVGDIFVYLKIDSSSEDDTTEPTEKNTVTQIFGEVLKLACQKKFYTYLTRQHGKCWLWFI